MFEVALELGIRRGELLKLRLDSLPRGANDGVLILRRPDDPNDSRPHEPAVKTAERAIPASRSLLSAIRAYLTYPPPLGRVSGKSPYLFVARSGAPLSSDRADDVIVAIGRHAGVTPLSWHRLRHTWAETMAEVLADQPNGMDRLVYLGGWKSPRRQVGISSALLRSRRRHQSVITSGSCTSWNHAPSEALWEPAPQGNTPGLFRRRSVLSTAKPLTRPAIRGLSSHQSMAASFWSFVGRP